MCFCFFFSSRRRHTRWNCDWSSDVCSSDLRCPGSSSAAPTGWPRPPPAVRWTKRSPKGNGEVAKRRSAQGDLGAVRRSPAMTTVPSPSRPGAGDEPAAENGDRLAKLRILAAVIDKPVPARTIVMGVAGVLLVAGAGIGAAAVLEPDPVLNGTAFSWLGYGHGKQMATAVLYVGITLLVLAWIRLGRDVLAGRVDRRGMLIAIGAWALPLLFAPPLFSRDLFSYLAQGDEALHGYDPYAYGVSVLNDHLSAN